MIFIRTDILNPYNPKVITQDKYEALIDFLLQYFPDGFDKPVDVSVNGIIIEVDNYDMALGVEDVIVILDRSALPVGLIGGWFVTALANLVISVTLSYVANKLFAPDAAEERVAPSPVYSVASGQNMARYGSPIPIIYGKVRMYPSMIVNPYYKFENNIEYLYHILCIGQGTNTTDNVQIGEDTITSPGDLQWKLLYPDSFYDIPTNAYGIHITRTLSSPSNIELKEGVLTEEYTIKQGTHTVEFDYHYPQGIYRTNSSGDYDWNNAAFNYYIRSSSGALLFTGWSLDLGMTADPIQKTISKNVSLWTTDDYVTISFHQDVTPDDSPGQSETNYIKRIKEIYPNKDFTTLYGDITLLAVKIKATNAVSSAGQVKVNGYFTRSDVGNSMEEVLTDIYTNTNYGGALDVDDLDFPATNTTVDCAYENNQTIFDAMRKPALAQGYSVFLAGMDVIMKKDGVNTVTSGMYNEMNIIRDSLKVQYLFKEESPSYDGYEVSYIEGNGWIPRTVTYPTWAIRPQKVDLFGVVDWNLIPPTPPVLPFEILVTSTIEPDFTAVGGVLTTTNNGDGTWSITGETGITRVYNNSGAHTTTIATIVCISADSLTSLETFCTNMSALQTITFGSNFITSTINSLYNAWLGCSNLSSFPVIDTSNVTNFAGAWYNCISLTTFPLLDTSSGADFRSTWFGANSIATLAQLDLSSGVYFNSAWRSCTALQYLPDLGIDTSARYFDYAFTSATSLVCISAINTSNNISTTGMFIDTPSLVNPTAAEQTAIEAGSVYINANPCP